MKAGSAAYHAEIPGQTGGALIRYRVRTTNPDGTKDFFPHEHALRPAFTSYVAPPREKSNIPYAFIINTDLGEMTKMNGLLKGAQKVGNSPWDNRGERQAMMQAL